MPKTVEQIKAEVTALVKSQGNQGAISLGTVLDDITELAGEGGGGTVSPMLISLYDKGNDVYLITSPSLEEIQRYAAAALDGANVSIKQGNGPEYSRFEIYPAFAYYDGDLGLQWSSLVISRSGVTRYDYFLNTSTGEVSADTKKYPSA